jgi:hypothetical protein
MRTAIAALLICAGAAATALAPTPERVEPGLAPEPGIPRFAGCFVQVERNRTGTVAVTSALALPARLTAVAAGSVVGETDVEVDGSGGGAVDQAAVTPAGPAGLLVELPTEDAAAGVLDWADDGVAAAPCHPPAPGPVTATGGSTLSGEELFLVLSNPYLIDAEVAVTSSSEVGPDSASQLERVLVPPRTVMVRSLSELLPLRRSLSVSVVPERGSAHVALVGAAEGDRFLVEAVPPALEWWIPVPPGDGELVVAAPGAGPVEVALDVYGPEGVTVEAITASIDAGSQAGFALSELGQGPLGVRVVASGPVVAGIAVRAPGIRAAGPGVAALAPSWFLPAAAAAGEATLLVFNPGPDEVEVVAQPLEAGAGARKVVAAPAALTAVRIRQAGPAGYVVRASSEVAVAWTEAGPAGLAYAAGVPREERGE